MESSMSESDNSINYRIRLTSTLIGIDATIRNNNDQLISALEAFITGKVYEWWEPIAELQEIGATLGQISSGRYTGVKMKDYNVVGIGELCDISFTVCVYVVIEFPSKRAIHTAKLKYPEYFVHTHVRLES